MTEYYIAIGNKVWKGASIAVSVWVEKTDETRFRGESWLDMRNRTEPARLEAEIAAQGKAALIADVLNSDRNVFHGVNLSQ
jgi:hypothetical protein